MASILIHMLWNAMEASLLALAVALACRLAKLSAPLRHGLWLLVVVKLFVPPLAVPSVGLSHGLLRAVDAARPFASWQLDRHEITLSAASEQPTELVQEADPLAVEMSVTSLDKEIIPEELVSNAAAASLDVRGADAEDFSGGSAAPESPRVQDTVAIIASGVSLADYLPLCVFLPWLLGSLGIVTYRVWQVMAIQEVLRTANMASEEIVAECKSVARRLGMSRQPAVKVVSLSVSPMVFALGRSVVALPHRLVAASRPRVLRNVLAHELAHLRRRDHWACWFELVGGCVYWWLPTFWWAGRERRRAADEAADGLAVSVLGCRQKYAESLLETVELLRADPVVVPVLGPALGERETIARRLTMIMREPLCPRLSWPARLGVALVGLLVLPAAPQRLRAQDPAKAPTSTPSEKEFEAVLEAIEQRPGQDNPAPPRDRRPEPPRPPEAPRGGYPGAERPESREPRDPERRLRDLEAKMDQVLQALQNLQAMGGRQGQLGSGMTQGMPGMPGMSGMSGRPGGNVPSGLPGGPPGAPGQPGGGPGMGPGGAGRGGSGGTMGGGGRGGMGGAGMGGPGGAAMGRTAGGPMGGGVPGDPRGAGTGDGTGPRDIARMLGGLDLSPEQSERIERAHQEIQKNIEKIAQEQARVNAEFQRRIAEVNRRHMEVIRELLSPEQRERLENRGREAGRGRGDGEPREGAGRRPEGDRPRDGGFRGEGDRPRDGGEPGRRQDGDRPRGDGDPNRRPDEGRPREGAGSNPDAS